MASLRVDSHSDNYTGVYIVDKETKIEWITTAAAAVIIKSTVANVTYLCREGEIRCEKFGRAWKVSKQDAERYVRSAREGRKPQE